MLSLFPCLIFLFLENCLAKLTAAVGEMLFVPLILLLDAFFGFDFTEPQDFVFPTLILLTPLVVGWWHRQGGRTLRADRAAEWGAIVAAIAGPLLLLVALYAVALRGQELLGHWPLLLRDDPKHISGGDLLYRRLATLVDYTSAFAAWTMVTWVSLMCPLFQRITRRRWWAHVLLFAATWIAFHLEPGGRWDWWLD